MIESLAKAAETAKPFSQSSESFNPDARLSSVEKIRFKSLILSTMVLTAV